MKKHYYSFLLLFATLFIWSSCNQEEGLGGSSSLEGHVYSVIHHDDNFTFQTDTFPALGKKVYLAFGDESNVGDDVDAGLDGYYRFNYLRAGNYTVYALSESVSGEKTAEIQKVKVGSGLNKADNIYIHSGKAYGTAMISGQIHARYYKSGAYRYDGPGIDIRVYICRAEEEIPFDDVKSGPNGVFVFQKLLPGNYIVYAVTEDPSEKVGVVSSEIIQIRQTEKVYNIPETFEVIVTI